jgi:NAD+ kinase
VNTPEREALLVTHTGRDTIVQRARQVAKQLAAAGFGLRVLDDEAAELGIDGATALPDGDAAAGTELVLALGGDGTFLRAAELARPVGAALLGVNLGRVGFLAEAEENDLDDTVRQIVARTYAVEERLTLDVTVRRGGAPTVREWALNEASVEKGHRERMLEVMAGVDGRPLSRWGCDGVIFATPTGSTAYAFSAGGPVVWPGVEALLMVPISAHALFAKPLVTAPTALLTADVLGGGTPPAVLCCDGRRTHELRLGDRIEVRRGALPVRVVRLHYHPFTDRLVEKFALPVAGWRGNGGERTGEVIEQTRDA